MDALSAQGNLSEARPASPAHILRATTNSVAPGGQSTLLTTTAPSIGGSSQTRPIERRGWVNSYEQTWVNFRERQGCHRDTPVLSSRPPAANEAAKCPEPLCPTSVLPSLGRCGPSPLRALPPRHRSYGLMCHSRWALLCFSI